MSIYFSKVFCFAMFFLHKDRLTMNIFKQIFLIHSSLVVWVPWQTNFCWLFNAKSILSK